MFDDPISEDRTEIIIQIVDKFDDSVPQFFVDLRLGSIGTNLSSP